MNKIVVVKVRKARPNDCASPSLSRTGLPLESLGRQETTFFFLRGRRKVWERSAAGDAGGMLICVRGSGESGVSLASHVKCIIHAVRPLVSRYSCAYVSQALTRKKGNRPTKKRDLFRSSISVCRCTHLWKSVLHLFLSLSCGGLYPDFDMRNSARIGWRSNIGGCSSASSMPVMPTAQMSHRWL